MAVEAGAPYAPTAETGRLGFSTGARRTRVASLLLVRVWRIAYPIVLIIACVYLLAPTFVAVLASISETAFLTFPPQGISGKWYANFFDRDDFVGSLFFSIGL